jgi:hypothetical protein
MTGIYILPKSPLGIKDDFIKVILKFWLLLF